MSDRPAVHSIPADQRTQAAYRAAKANGAHRPAPVAQDVPERPLQLLTVSDLIERPPPRWLVRGWMHSDALAVVYGEPGSRKTFLMLDMALAIARGVRWFGQRVRQGGVIYIAGEGALQSRLLAYIEHHDLRHEDLNGLRVVDRRVALIEPRDDVAELVSLVKSAAAEMPPMRLCVIDTLARAMAGHDENGPAAMTAAIAGAERIRDALQCAVCVVHHTGKNGAGARGHSSLKGAIDCEIEVAQNGTTSTATLEKLRDGPKNLSLSFSLDVVDLGPSPDPDAEPDERISSCVVVPVESDVKRPREAKQKRADPKGRNQRAVLDELRKLIAEVGERSGSAGLGAIPAGVRYVRVEQIVERAEHRLLDLGRYKAQRIREALEGLQSGGHIGISDPFLWCIE